ncbi:MAG: two-component response regulator [Chthonomonadales bacterium]|nr:two-component response regulator [Chthonomonadales bacterium]
MNRTVSVSPAPCISIVDDDKSIREAIKSLLGSLGFRTEVFASAEEFLNSSRLPDTECLILDIWMPGMSGLELQNALAAADSRIPIIFITANDDEEARARALRAGAVAFLRKPFHEDALLNGIHSALDQHGE